MGVSAPKRRDKSNAIGLVLLALTISKPLPFASDVNRSRCAGLFISCWLAAACAEATDESTPALSYTGEPAPAEAELASEWCLAKAVLERKCQRCHGEMPEHGASFSLVTYEDTQVVSAKGKPRYEQVAAAVGSDFMPPSFLKLSPAVEPLTELERAALLGWCESGAPGPAPADPPCDAR